MDCTYKTFERCGFSLNDFSLNGHMRDGSSWTRPLVLLLAGKRVVIRLRHFAIELKAHRFDVTSWEDRSD